MILRFKLTFSLFFSLSVGFCWGQRQERLTGLQRVPVTAEETIALKHKSQNSAVNLPFEDDFSYKGRWPNPALWADSNVYINQTLAQSPITLGVATFDGLDKFGFAYNLNRQATDTADVLTSRSIDLSNPVDSVYLSFYYQPGGLAEPPSTQDSLTLQFWNESDSSWTSIWRTFGGGLSVFEQVMIPVPDLFHNPNFRFRFTSYGSLAGTFDVWHLDYVRLDDQRTTADTLLQDIAFTRPHPSLLQRYEALPWFHVDRIVNPAQIAKPDLRLFYRRNVNPAQPRPSMFLGEFTITQNGTVLDQNGQPDANLDDSHPSLEEVRYPVPDTADAGRARLSYLPTSLSGETTLISTHTYSGSNQNYSANDTVVKEQHFKNYYAYDDGSAERGYEILNNQGGFIVQRYDLLGSDTLKGLYLYFSPAFYNIKNKGFTIVAYSNNSGLPGNLLFESDSVYEPQYSEHDFYLPYALDSSEQAAILNQTVFIGIRQVDNTPLTLGYDANAQDATTAFYGEVNDLFQSFLPGSIMMRPYFRYQPANLSADKPKLLTKQNFSLYPNPSTGRVRLQGLENLEPQQELYYQVHSLKGQLLQEGKAQEELYLNLAPGLYIFHLQERSGSAAFTTKLNIR